MALLAAAAAALALGLTVVHARMDHAGTTPAAWLALAVVFLITEISPVHFEHRRESISVSLSTIPMVVGLFTVGPVGLVTARLAGSVAALVLHRRQSPLKLAMNLSSFWLETAVAITVFRVLQGQPSAGLMSWPGAFGAALAGDAVVTLLLLGAISLYQRRWEHGLESVVGVGSLATAVDTCVALLAVTVLRQEPAALLLMAVVAGMLLVSYRVHRSFREKHHHLEELYDFTSKISDALTGGVVTSTLLTEVRELMHAEHVRLCLPGPDGLMRVDLRGAATLETHPATALDETLHRDAHASAEPVLLAAESVGEGEPGHVGGLIAAAVVGPSGVIGTLVVADRSGDVRPYGEEDLRLFTAVVNHAGVALDNAELVDRLREQAELNLHQSLHDSLTGLPNRRYFLEELERAVSTGSTTAVLVLDLDRFKDVNDTLGHHHGDLLLQQVGDRLRAALRQDDLVARLGGDEFAILLRDVAGEMAAVQAARGVAALLEQPFAIADVSVDVGASVGVVIAPEHGRESAVLMQRADVAMYAAKGDQSSVEVYQAERDDSSRARLSIVADLRRAIKAGEMELHYQPQVDLVTGRVMGTEALVRWRHPERGLVPPDEFIFVAERTGLIRPLTELVLEGALIQTREWEQAGVPLRISVNISARSLLQPSFVDDITGIAASVGVKPSSVCLELTESSIMQDPRRAVPMLEALDGAGFTVAIDDFGTGHSSLAYLSTLPVKELKIDKSFVMKADDDAPSRAIVKTVIDLARNLSLPVVAEGVETETMLGYLRAAHCTIAQGYHISRPMPGADVLPWLESYRPPFAGPARGNVQPLRPASAKRRYATGVK